MSLMDPATISLADPIPEAGQPPQASDLPSAPSQPAQDAAQQHEHHTIDKQQSITSTPAKADASGTSTINTNTTQHLIRSSSSEPEEEMACSRTTPFKRAIKSSASPFPLAPRPTNQITPKIFKPTPKLKNALVVTLNQITASIYSMYCEETMSGKRPENATEDEARILGMMQESGDFAVTEQPSDELLQLTAGIIHLPTKKLIVPPNEKNNVISRAVLRYSNEKHPVALALQHIQKHYAGMPPVVQVSYKKEVGNDCLQLRNEICTELKRVLPEAVSGSDGAYETLPVMIRRLRSGEFGGSSPKKSKYSLLKNGARTKMIPVKRLKIDESARIRKGTGRPRGRPPSKKNDVEEMEGEDTMTEGEMEMDESMQEMNSMDDGGGREEMETMGWNPEKQKEREQRMLHLKESIPAGRPVTDEFYDILAEVVAGRQQVEQVEEEYLRNVLKMRHNGELIAEFWTAEDKEIGVSAGWRLRFRANMKHIIRTSEVDQVFSAHYERLSATHSKKDILHLIDESFVGLVTKQEMTEAARLEVLKGSRVCFPNQPRVYGYKPMQYLQIDMIEMILSQYGDKVYSHALIVTDLYSGFVFGRALVENIEPPLLVRHLMDIFGSFGPPEVFRSFSNSPMIGDVMMHIGRLFKVHIKNVGIGPSLHTQLRREIIGRANRELGVKERWLETLPTTCIEYNQTVSKTFDFLLTPFEMMFGRRPWRNLANPPWIESREKETKGRKSGGGGEGDEKASLPQQDDNEDQMGRPKKGRKRNADKKPGILGEPLVLFSDAPGPSPSLAETRKKIKAQTSLPQTAVYDETGELTDPGTGYLFQAGDKVYVRNPSHRDLKGKDKTAAASCNPRYFRGVIAELDVAHVDFLYRVVYWDDGRNPDEIPNNMWPEEDDVQAFTCEMWVGPWDVTASSNELGRLRNAGRIRREKEARCKCGKQECTVLKTERCERNMNYNCCIEVCEEEPDRQPPCKVHMSMLSERREREEKIRKGWEERERKEQEKTRRAELAQHAFMARARQMGGQDMVSSTGDANETPSPHKFDNIRESSSARCRLTPQSDTRWTFLDGKLVEVKMMGKEAGVAKKAPVMQRRLVARAANPFGGDGRPPRIHDHATLFAAAEKSSLAEKRVRFQQPQMNGQGEKEKGGDVIGAAEAEEEQIMGGEEVGAGEEGAAGEVEEGTGAGEGDARPSDETMEQAVAAGVDESTAATSKEEQGAAQSSGKVFMLKRTDQGGSRFGVPPSADEQRTPLHLPMRRPAILQHNTAPHAMRTLSVSHGTPGVPVARFRQEGNARASNVVSSQPITRRGDDSDTL